MGRGNNNSLLYGGMGRTTAAKSDDEYFKQASLTANQDKNFFSQTPQQAVEYLRSNNLESDPAIWLAVIQEDLPDDKKKEYFDKLSWYKTMSLGRKYNNEIIDFLPRSLDRFSKTVGRQIDGSFKLEQSLISGLSQKNQNKLHEISRDLRGMNELLNFKDFPPLIEQAFKILPVNREDVKQQMQPVINDNQKLFNRITDYFKVKQEPAPELIEQTKTTIEDILTLGAVIEVANKGEIAPLDEATKKFYSSQIEKNYVNLRELIL